MHLLPVSDSVINLKPSLTITTPLKLLQHDHVLLHVVSVIQFLGAKHFLTPAFNSCGSYLISSVAFLVEHASTWRQWRRTFILLLDANEHTLHLYGFPAMCRSTCELCHMPRWSHNLHWKIASPTLSGSPLFVLHTAT